MGKEADAKTIGGLSPDVTIIATGSKPITPNIPGAEKTATARQVLGGGIEVGKSAVVVGGNAIGCETAEWLAAKGKQVILVEMLDELGSDIEPVTKYALLPRLNDYGVKIVTGKKVIEVIEKGVICLDKQWQKTTLRGDTIIFAVGALPNNELYEELKNRTKNVYVIGDAKEPRRIINAISEGYKLARLL